jgi:hypothetical protein
LVLLRHTLRPGDLTEQHMAELSIRARAVHLRSLALVIAVLSVLGMSAGSMGQAFGGHGNPMGPPQYPYPIYGYIWQAGGHTPIVGASVWVNDTNTGVSLQATTDSQGRYQQDLANGSVSYNEGDNVTVTALWSHFEGSNWTLVTWVTVPPAGSWCNVSISSIPLSAVMSAKPSTVFVGEQTTLSVLAQGGLPPYTFNWTFGDGTAEVQTFVNSTTHAYSSVGTFQANVTVTDSRLATANSSVNVTVQSTPTLGLAFVPPAPQVGITVTFTSSLSVAGNGWVYFFVFGDGTNSGYLAPGVAVATHVYSATGTYTANSTAYNSTTMFMVDSNTVQVPVGHAIAVGLTVAPSPTEVGLDTVLTANSSDSNTPVNYTFAFGDGATAGPQSSAIADHVYSAPGSVTASVVGTNDTGASASASAPLAVLPHVQVTWILPPASGNEPLYVPVRAGASSGESPYTYTISFSGPSYTSSFTNTSGYANVTLHTVGTYVASVEVTDNLGVTVWGTNETFDVTFSPPTLNASISGPTTGQIGENLTFDLTFSGGVGPYVVTWLYGDGSKSTPQSGVTTSPVGTWHTYGAIGTYVLTAFINDSMSDSAKATLTVSITEKLPTAIMSADPDTIFAGGQTLLSAIVLGGTSPFTYTWTFGDGATPKQTSTNFTSHVYAKAGSYQANVTVGDALGFNATSSVLVTVLAHPALALTFSPSAPFVGSVVTFHSTLSVSGKGWTYYFVFGDGTSSGYLPAGVATTTHTYTVQGTYSSNSTAYNTTTGYRVDSHPVSVPVGPVMSVGLQVAPSPTEVGRSTLFTANSSNSQTSVKYTFAFGDGASAGPQSAVTAHHTYAAAGNVNASVTGTNLTGSSAIYSLSLSVLAHVQVAWLIKPNSGVVPLVVEVRAGASLGEGPYSYRLFFNGLAWNASFTNPSGWANVTMDETGAFTAGVEVTDSLGMVAWGTNLSYNVTLGPSQLTAAISGPTSGNVGSNLTFVLSFTGGVGPYVVTWRYGDGTGSTPQTGVASSPTTTIHSYALATTYYIAAFVNDSSGHSARANWTVVITQSSPIGPGLIFGVSEPVFILLIVIIALILALILFVVWRRRKKQKADEETAKEVAASSAAAATAAEAAKADASDIWKEDDETATSASGKADPSNGGGPAPSVKSP